MTLKYESELLYELMKRDGDDTPSDVLPYESELKEKYLNQVVGAYPKLQDYRPEWLNYNLYHHLPSNFPVETVTNVSNATFQNVVPYAYGQALLKGQTLVNLSGNDRISNTGFFTYADGVYKHLNDVNYYHDDLMIKDNTTSMFSPNKIYTFIIDSKVLLSEVDGYTNPPRQHGVIIQFEDDTYQTPMTPFQNVGERIEQKIKFTIENKPIKKVLIRTFTASLSKAGKFNGEIYKVVLVEGDYTNQDIPYFEGMQSVEMPVLTTSTFIPMYSFLKDDGRENFTKLYTEFYEVTKDTFTFKQSGHFQRIGITTDNFEKEGKQTLERNKEYQFKIEILKNTLSIDMEIRCNSKYTDGVTRIVRVGETPIYEFSKTITSEIPEDDVNGSGEMILFYLPSGYNGEVSFKVTIGVGNINNIKTNILTVNEPIELRGIGDTRDELDCLTGELTQRIGSTLIEGGYWSFNGTHSKTTARFSYSKRILTGANTPNRNIVSDKIPTLPNDYSYEKESYGIGGFYEDMLYLYIPRSWIGLDIDDNDTISANEKIKTYMDNLGEVRVQYQLATESVKTVELTCVNEQGEKVNLMPIEGTMHVSTTSQTLPPLLDMRVPVEAITQNLNSFANMSEE